MTKQTAVEWLYSNLKSHFEHDGDLLEVVQFSFEQAKEMEKQQGYSEEEVIEILLNCRGENPRYIEEWFEQFKKK
jgi:hypothetical protein